MKTTKPRVLLDVDGVLADFLTPSLKVIESVTGEPVPPEYLTEWDFMRHYDKETSKKFYDIFKSEGWCFNLEVYPGAVEAVKELRGYADVYFVTSPMHGRHWAFERTEWLDKHFGARRDHVVHTNAKYLCVGDVLVDDKPSHIIEWELSHPKGTGLLWNQPYNKYDVPRMLRAHDWFTVLNVAHMLAHNTTLPPR